jgi:hypothetical protein
VNLTWIVRTLAFAAVAAGACSCALLTQGTTEEITFNSDPPGATVTLNNGETKVTPFSMAAPREQDLQFHFSKPGYQSVDLSDNSRVEGGYMAADIIPFMLPWAVDAASGAGFVHQQTSVTAHLEPIRASISDEVPSKPDKPVPPTAPSTGAAAVSRTVN